MLPNYAREYEFADFKLRVKAVADELVLNGPAMGDFSLLPLSGSQFLVEDIGAPVTFELDENQTPAAMIIEAAPGQKRRGRPVSP
jgi:hypothetical protein